MQDFCTLEKLVNSVMVEYKEFRISKGKKVLPVLFLHSQISIRAPSNNDFLISIIHFDFNYSVLGGILTGV